MSKCTSVCRKEEDGNEVHVHRISKGYTLEWTDKMPDGKFLNIESNYRFKDMKEIKEYIAQPKDEWL